MSTLTEKTFKQEVIDSSEDEIYVGTATDIIKEIWITNVHTADVTVTVWFIPSGGSSGDDYKLLNAQTIPVNDFVKITTYLPMATGSKISALCSVANKATILLAGASIT